MNYSTLSYQSSVSASMANVTHVSLRDKGSEAPKELFGFIYDIPKDSGITNADLVKIFQDLHISCQIQVKRDEKKPFYSARVKFSNSVHMRVATEKMRYFKLTEANGLDRQCRFLPYLQSLSKEQPEQNTSSLMTPVNPELSVLGFSESQQSENLPDNSHLQCNMCVTGLDESITAEDLHKMFSVFGQVKSAKVATDS